VAVLDSQTSQSVSVVVVSRVCAVVPVVVVSRVCAVVVSRVCAVVCAMVGVGVSTRGSITAVGFPVAVSVPLFTSVTLGVDRGGGKEDSVGVRVEKVLVGIGVSATDDDGTVVSLPVVGAVVTAMVGCVV